MEGEDGYSSMERTSIRPTLDVNGIWGGYTGEGAKTVIASKAYAKISMRLVPNQDLVKLQSFSKITLSQLLRTPLVLKLLLIMVDNPQLRQPIH